MRGRRIAIAAFSILMLSGAMTVTPGCDTDRGTRVQRTSEPGLVLHPTARKIYAGEVVTVTTETMNLVGRDAEIRWSTTGGELSTQDNNRIARVKFDRPGKYVIASQLWADNEMVKSDSVQVEVLPLN